MADVPHSTALRITLPIAVFLSGASLLSLEIAASRVMAPYFGNSIYVWGALIGVILTGLSIGYWVGGILADRLPKPWLLSLVLIIGGLLVLLILVISDPLQGAISRWNPGLRSDPLLAATGLFGPASIVLAMSTPIAVRLSARYIERVGAASGRLFSISTGGSIVGVLLTAFFLVPRLGVERLLALDALVILMAAALVAISGKLLPLLAAALVGCALAGGVAMQGPQSSLKNAAPSFTPAWVEQGHLAGHRPDFTKAGLKVLYQKDSQYHRITVAENATSRFLHFDSSFQSGMSRKDPFYSLFAYARYLDIGMAYNPNARRALMIGLGGGSVEKQLWRTFPRLTLTTIELDPAVRDVAYRYFSLPHDSRLPIVIQDGRRYLDLHSTPQDIIMIDAFFADAVPFHLTTQEFLRLVASRLAPGGVVVTNAIGSLEGVNSKLLRSFIRTYSSVFPMVEIYPVSVRGHACRTTVCNVIIVAGSGPRLTEAEILAGWKRALAGHTSPIDMGPIASSRLPYQLPLGDVPTLTDDYAPTDSLLPLYNQGS